MLDGNLCSLGVWIYTFFFIEFNNDSVSLFESFNSLNDMEYCLLAFWNDAISIASFCILHLLKTLLEYFLLRFLKLSWLWVGFVCWDSFSEMSLEITESLRLDVAEMIVLIDILACLSQTLILEFATLTDLLARRHDCGPGLITLSFRDFKICRVQWLKVVIRF